MKFYELKRRKHSAKPPQEAKQAAAAAGGGAASTAASSVAVTAGDKENHQPLYGRCLSDDSDDRGSSESDSGRTHSMNNRLCCVNKVLSGALGQVLQDEHDAQLHVWSPSSKLGPP